jgi:hypothetical protein
MIITPYIFTNTEDISLIAVKEKLQSSNHWIQFISQITRLDIIDISDTKAGIDLLLHNATNDYEKSVLYIGLSRYFKAEGDLLKTANSLSIAINYYNKIDRDVNLESFIYVEMSILMGLTRNRRGAQDLLSKIDKQNSSEKIVRYAEFRELENRIWLDNNVSISELEISKKYFEKQNDYAMIAYHYKNMALVCRKQSDFKSAMNHLISGLQLAIEHNLSHVEEILDHDVAMLHFRTGHETEAISQLSSLFMKTQNKYIQCITSANTGFIALKTNNNDIAVEHFQKSLNIAVEFGIYHMTPGLCNYLSKIYEDKDQIELAAYFSNKGFHSAINLVENHFPCVDDTLIAIKGYQKFIETHKNSISIQKPKANYKWEELYNQSLVDIKVTFQKTLIEKVLANPGMTKKNASKELGISERNLFVILNKPNTIKIKDNNSEISAFIQENKENDWKILNNMFEQNVLNTLYTHYGENKKILASKLNVSYSSIINKIKKN